MRYIALVLAIALSGCAATVYDADGFPSNMDGPQQGTIPASAKIIRVSGEVFRRITGSELRQAVVGQMIFLDPSVILDSGTSHGDGAWFDADGRSYYWSRFRLGHGRGTYRVRFDDVCTSGNTDRCFSLFRSANGRYLRHTPGLSAPSLVTVRPIEPSWSPRLN
jgi:hypothetical protein